MIVKQFLTTGMRLQFSEVIRRFGIAITGQVSHDTTKSYHYYYTVGLHDMVGYEIAVFGISQEEAQDVLTHVAAYCNRVINDIKDPDGHVMRVRRYNGEPLRMGFKEMLPALAREYGVIADQYHKVDVKMYQIVLPDDYNLLPWEEGNMFDQDSIYDLYQPRMYDMRPKAVKHDTSGELIPALAKFMK